jgi:hypothetical protein
VPFQVVLLVAKEKKESGDFSFDEAHSDANQKD